MAEYDKVTLIVPIYNEAQHLEKFLKKLDQLQLSIKKELVFIDDCSQDDSLQILRNFSFESEHQILALDMNQGKGNAIASGIQKSTGNIIGIQDADFEYDLDDIQKLLDPLIARKADVVYGSRFIKTSPQVHRTFHTLVNRFLTTLSNFCSGLYLSDMETCYKFFRAEILKNVNLESKRFGFEPEITAKIACLNLKVMEFPISYFPRSYLEGKKITWKDGVSAIMQIFYFNLVADKKKFFKQQMDQQLVLPGYKWL